MIDSSTDALAALEFLASSPARVRILDALADGPATARELADQTGIPRSTLRRNLGELVDRGYVARDAAASTHALSAVGVTVRETVRDAMATVADAKALVPFLDHFPAELPVEASAISDADVVGSLTDDPFRPVSATRERLRNGGDVCGFVPVINPLYLKGLHACVGEDRDVEVAAPRSAYAARVADDPERVHDIVDSSNVHLFEAETVPDYALGVGDHEVLLGAFDDHMRTHSVLFGERDGPVGDWAADRYADVRETAETLDPDAVQN
jgi:predicted transcriptional regulator